MTNDEHALGPWRPWKPGEVEDFFSALTVPWWIAGGWALDLFVGRQTREHEDIDVQVLRRDQEVVRALFGGWDVQGAHPEVKGRAWPFREWEVGRLLDSVVHDVWCRPQKSAPWVLQLMIADSDGDQWFFRRDRRISRPIDTIGNRTAEGIPYLAPEIQLLYKAKQPRAKDEADFAMTLPYLGRESREWLAQALALVHPGHPWLSRIEPNGYKNFYFHI